MEEGKLRWCAAQGRGIELTELKPHLSLSYMQEADETLVNALAIAGKWKAIMSYYACYSAIYSLLMKAGIRCEIHDCTISLMSLFGFGKDETEFVKALKKGRIDAQYYMKKVIFEDDHKLKDFILRCKRISEGLNSTKIEDIRSKIKKMQND